MRVNWYNSNEADMPLLIAKKMAEDGHTKVQARRWVLANTPPEKKYQRKILDYLEALPGAYCWKEHSGGYQKSGIPDICLIYKGQFFAFEVKRPYGLNKATELQQLAIKGINKAGGHAHVVSFVDEVERIVSGEVDNEQAGQ